MREGCYRYSRAATLGEARWLSRPGYRPRVVPAGLVLGTSESFVGMVVFAAGVLALGLGATALWIKGGTKRVIRQTHEAARSEGTEVSDQ